jgi:hypothetical protein
VLNKLFLLTKFISNMKKLLIIAMAALTLVACKDKKGEPQLTNLTLNESEVSIAVASTFQLTANMQVTWSSSDEDVATVNDNGLVYGVTEGEATITAKAVNSNELASCKVTVTGGGITPPPAGNPYDEFPQLQGSEYYVFFLQSGATEYLGDKVIYNFGPNDHPDAAQEGKSQGSRWLYIWDKTFTGGTAVGTDPFDQAEGWTSLVQQTGGSWAGMGLCVAINDDNNVSGEGAAEDLAALNAMQNHITDYEEWYLAVGLKNSTQGAAYEFSLIGSNIYDAGQAKGIEYGVGKQTVAPAATGEWVYKEYKLSDIPGLEFGDFTTNGSNILTVVATPYMGGTQFDLGYAFLYKK